MKKNLIENIAILNTMRNVSFQRRLKNKYIFKLIILNIMQNFKKYFPIFANNPGLVFFDSGASAQKPGYVIDGVKQYLENDYANIHRGSYDLSERSELLYEDSKKKVADFINANSRVEISYTYNATYAMNLLATSLARSKQLVKGDKVLVLISEHHANVVPWLILKEEIGIELDFVMLDDNYEIDFEDFKKKLDDKVKIVSFAYVSNVTGTIFDLPKVNEILKKMKNRPLFVIDASQAIQHFKVDVQALDCDYLVFTGHKIMAEGGIGVLYGKKELLKELRPSFSGGGSINWVKKDSFQDAGLPSKFEMGTPNLNGAVSLLKALEFIESIGGYETLTNHENELVAYFLEKFKKYEDKIELIGPKDEKNRVGVFSIKIKGMNQGDVSDFMSEHNICVRAGHHCAEPFMTEYPKTATCRVSLYIYNDKEDIDKFFIALDELLNR
ncbi:MAG: aminotransferase class V-fold PLP-dependent enzyme [Candidatus Gracilibacteria bacterium]|nr:aminotransferase class V-fold PLP-dependent enzyme [Candidatus Gracilibacteria bacterium]